MRRQQQTRTSGGAYQNPTEGIVDYSAFNRGLQAGLKPGLDFLKEQEKKEEAEKKALGIKRTKLAGEIDDVENVAAGGAFGSTLNPGLNTVRDYKNLTTNIRSEILDPNTSDARVKELSAQTLNIKKLNSTLQYLIDIDNDPNLIDIEASDINALFESQGTTFEKFTEKYNNGNAKPTVKTIDGVNVGGFTMNVDGKEIFLDFENKINKTTIDSKSSFNAKASMQKIGAEFNDQSKGSFENTQEYMNAKGDIVKLTNIATQYTKGVDTFATTKAKEYLGKNPELNASIFSSALRQTKLLKSSLTEEELAVLKATGGKYINYNKKAVLALVGFEKTKALASGAPMSDSLAESIVNDNIDALRNKINNIYVKNEFLKQNENFSLNPETGIAEPRGPQIDVKLDKSSIGKDKTENENVDLLFKQINEVPEKIVYAARGSDAILNRDRNITKLLNTTTNNESQFITNREFKDFFFKSKRNEGELTEDQIKEDYSTKIREFKGSTTWQKKGGVYTGLVINNQEQLIEAMVNAVDYDGMDKLRVQARLNEKFKVNTRDKYNK